MKLFLTEILDKCEPRYGAMSIEAVVGTMFLLGVFLQHFSYNSMDSSCLPWQALLELDAIIFDLDYKDTYSGRQCANTWARSMYVYSMPSEIIKNNLQNYKRSIVIFLNNSSKNVMFSSKQ